jgi:hypothetical protein
MPRLHMLFFNKQTLRRCTYFIDKEVEVDAYDEMVWGEHTVHVVRQS